MSTHSSVKHRWNSHVLCPRCEEDDLMVRIARLEEKYVVYNYICDTCRVEGPWSGLAKAMIG